MRAILDAPAQDLGGNSFQFRRAGIPACFDGRLASDRMQQRVPGGSGIGSAASAQLFQDLLNGRNRILRKNAGRRRTKNHGVLTERLQFKAEVGKEFAEGFQEVHILRSQVERHGSK